MPKERQTELSLRKLLPIWFTVISVALWPAIIQAQVATKTPPTPFPTTTSAQEEPLSTESNWHRALERGFFTVGIRYNHHPYSWLDIRGNVTGFDADILRSVAALWELAVKFEPVTRHTATEMLHSGEVDFIAGGQPLFAHQLAEVSFSQPYHLDAVQIFVQTEAPWQSIEELIGHNVGVKSVSEAEDFIREWIRRNNFAFQFQPKGTLDLGLKALLMGELDATLGLRSEFSQLEMEPGQIRPLEEQLGEIPIAFALPRSDSILKDVINHSLQQLTANGRMRELHAIYFPSFPHDRELIPRYVDVHEDAAFNPPAAITFPEHFALPRLRETETLRVILVDQRTAPLQQLSSQIAAALAERCNLTMEITVLDALTAQETLQRGEADLLVGIEPRWAHSAVLDFTQPYLKQGLILMTREADRYEQMTDLPSPITLYLPAEDPISQSQIEGLLEPYEIELAGVQVVTSPFIINSLLGNPEVDAILGNSAILAPLLQQNGQALKVMKDGADVLWFTNSYLSLATPKNDVAFFQAIELAVQELRREQAFTDLMRPFVPSQLPETSTREVYWPGSLDSPANCRADDA
ncbi:MAG: transporter substrate-binding domain-containing protein [Anaerolineaceae bacterium]|nr:transporter substrate-binding domain-containing protein [Anaerolineaceae bacterium]